MDEKKKKIFLITLGVIIVLLVIILLFILLGKKEYVISFDTNGGTTYENITIDKNGTLTKPNDPVREGYEFAGWYYNDEPFDFNTKITSDMVLEARWKEVSKEVTGISLNVTSLDLKPDSKALLEVIFTPEGSSSELIWQSSDSKVVKVNENGELEALKEGEATITVTTKDGKYSATCKVKVDKNIVSVTSVSISGKKEVNVGESIKLTATIKPKDATNKEVTWTSSDSSIATVDKNGNVKGLKSGKVTITVITVEGEKKAIYNIEVKDNNQSISGSQGEETSTPTGGESKPSGGESTTPSEPSTDNNPGGNTSSEPNTPQNPSSSTTPTNPDKDTPSNPDTSNVKVQKIEATIDKSTIYVGEKAKITYTITPSNATNKEVTLTSSDSNIATIDKSGNVTGKTAGTVEITIKATDGSNVTAKVTLTVKNKEVPVQGITINEGDSLSLEEGKTKQLTYTISPSNATNQKVNWKSDNAAVSVDSKGKITANKVGTANVTVTTEDGKHEDTITITVTEKPVNYTINFKREYEMGEVVSYVMTVKRNNSSLPSNEEFCYIIYDGKQRRWVLNESGGVPKPSVKESITDAEIVIKVNGTEKRFPVKINYTD